MIIIDPFLVSVKLFISSIHFSNLLNESLSVKSNTTPLSGTITWQVVAVNKSGNTQITGTAGAANSGNGGGAGGNTSGSGNGGNGGSGIVVLAFYQ